LNNILELVCQHGFVLGFDAGREADVMKQTVGIVKTQQDRTDKLATRVPLLGVAEAADHAVGASELLYLLHAFAVAGLIRQIEPLRDYAVAAPRPPI
jgi:hypothetical protein